MSNDSILGDIAEAVSDGFKKFGKSAVSQVTGTLQDQGTMTAADLKAMAKSDKEFSKNGEAEVKAKIARIYAEYAQKRAQEQQQQTLAKQQQGQEKSQIEEVKKEEMKNPIVERAKAEIKNYGAE